MLFIVVLLLFFYLFQICSECQAGKLPSSPTQKDVLQLALFPRKVSLVGLSNWIETV